MSNGPIPKKIDPRKMAERGAQISAEVAVSAMPEFCDMLADQDARIQVELDFSIDEQRIRLIQGQATGQVNMICQRCLEPVEITVAATFNLGIAASEEAAKQLPRYYDPVIVEAEELELIPLVQEELILSIPHDAYHEDCSIQTSFGEPETVATESKKPNPFSVLANLKKADTK
ncbi:YceD family protein [Pontibacter sp. JAM-7]|uniref:YceD family protein n=1 Tax=Pontibacter sp. JAM-7 TaxID=3366581 RepID=UPI003AF8CF01